VIKMNYKDMIEFIPKYDSKVQFELALNAGIVRQIIPNTTVTKNIIDERKPFKFFHFENRSGEAILISIDGIADTTTNTITNSKFERVLQSNEAIDIIPDELPSDILFETIAIKNTDAVNNTANNELSWSIRNF